MHYALQRLLASGLLDAANTEAAEAALQGHQHAFADGLGTIKIWSADRARGGGYVLGRQLYGKSGLIEI